MDERYVELNESQWADLRDELVDLTVWDAYIDTLHNRIVALVTNGPDDADSDAYNLLLDAATYEPVVG